MMMLKFATRQRRFRRNRQRGFSLIELLIVVAIILIIAAIAIPNLLNSRERANEAAAVEALHTLTVAQASYIVTYGNNSVYAGSLAILGPGNGASCDKSQACLVDGQLGCGAPPCQRGSFNFYMAGNDPFFDYAFTATPVVWNMSGAKNFCTVEDGVIRFEFGGSASLGAAVDHKTCSNFAIYGGI